jgi:hypothetical protein
VRISTNEHKHLRAKLRSGWWRKCPHRLRPLLPRHNMHADELGG